MRCVRWWMHFEFWLQVTVRFLHGKVAVCAWTSVCWINLIH